MLLNQVHLVFPLQWKHTPQLKCEKSNNSINFWALTCKAVAFQGVDGRSGPPRVQAIRGYLVCREFKNSNKPTRSQSAFYYPSALAILNNSHSSLPRLMAPITATSPWSTTSMSAQHHIKCFTETLFEPSFTDRKRGLGDLGKREDLPQAAWLPGVHV